MRFSHIAGRREHFWICKCDCGGKAISSVSNINRGHVKSCGCLQRECGRRIGLIKKHGMWGTKIYRIWDGMKRRCENPTTKCYKNYGGRGISLCTEWHDAEGFIKWSMNNGYIEGLSIDRINNNGNYSPSNCQWLTVSENAKKRNRELQKYKEGFFFKAQG